MPNARTIFLLLLVVLIVLLASGMVGMTEIVAVFDLVLLRPILNFLVLLTGYLFGSFGLAIVVLTIVIRLVTLPLTVKQLHSSRAMQAIQPKLAEVRKKYAKDKQRLGDETMKLYKEHGVSPFGCAFPMLAQFPIWIGLYQAVIQGLGIAPENLLGLSKQLYSWAPIQGQVPLDSHFLWLDLGSGDIFMGILVAASMWVLQKMSTLPSADPTQQSMSRVMIWMMPLMFGFLALTFPSGLSLYWVLTNLVSIVIQYRVSGWGSLRVPSLSSLREGRILQPADTAQGGTGTSVGSGEGGDIGAPQLEGAEADSAASGRKGADGSSPRKKVRYGKHRDKRKFRRRGR
ncbi:MAG: membrane protein insertase YidC [Dehalococcoidia bacterium]|nr:MAG: membrane protein insertase YidC [Dehalococcoidia bacterium]